MNRTRARLLGIEALERRRLLAIDLTDWTREVQFDDREAKTSEAIGALAGTISIGQRAVPYHNPLWNVDVDNDKTLSPSDALIIINFLNAGREELPPIFDALPEMRIDVDGDNNASPIDALLVINAINGGEKTSPISTVAATGTSFDDEIKGKVLYEENTACGGSYSDLVEANGKISGTYEGFIESADMRVFAVQESVQLQDGPSIVEGTRYIARANISFRGWGIADFNISVNATSRNVADSRCTTPQWIDSTEQTAEFVGTIAVRGSYDVHIVMETYYDVLTTPDSLFPGDFVAGILNSTTFNSSAHMDVQADYMDVHGTILANESRLETPSTGEEIAAHTRSTVQDLQATGAEHLSISASSLRVRSLIYPNPRGTAWQQEQYRSTAITVDAHPQTISGLASVDVLFRDETDKKSGDLEDSITAFVRGPTDDEALEAHKEVFEKRDLLFDALFPGS